MKAAKSAGWRAIGLRPNPEARSPRPKSPQVVRRKATRLPPSQEAGGEPTIDAPCGAPRPSSSRGEAKGTARGGFARESVGACLSRMLFEVRIRPQMASPDTGLCKHTDAQEISGVITGLVPVIHVFIAASLFIAANEARRGWPDQVRP